MPSDPPDVLRLLTCPCGGLIALALGPWQGDLPGPVVVTCADCTRVFLPLELPILRVLSEQGITIAP